MGWFSEETCEGIFCWCKVREEWCGEFSSGVTSAHTNYFPRYLAEIYELVRHGLSCGWAQEVPMASNLLLCFGRAWISLLVCMFKLLQDCSLLYTVYYVLMGCSISNNLNTATANSNQTDQMSWAYLTMVSRNHHGYTALTTQIPSLMHNWGKSSQFNFEQSFHNIYVLQVNMEPWTLVFECKLFNGKWMLMFKVRVTQTCLLISSQARNKYHCWSFYFWDENFARAEIVTDSAAIFQIQHW